MMKKSIFAELLLFLILIYCLLLILEYALYKQPSDAQFDHPVNQVQPTLTLTLETNVTLLSCIERGDKCAFEDIGKFLEGTALGIVHEPLQSVPSYRRIPHHMSNNWTYIQEQHDTPPKDGSRTALHDYNPVLFPLYLNGENGTLAPSVHIDLLDRLTGRYHPYFSEVDANQVKYLAISRITDMHSCGPHISANFDPYKGNQAQSYVGISLLDENLTPIKGANIAINLGLWILRKYTLDFVDFYIYSARTTKGSVHKDQLFLQATGQTYSFLFPLDIRRVPPSTSGPFNKTLYPNFDDSWNTKVKGSPIPMDNDKLTYGNGLQVRFMDDLRNQKRQGGIVYMNGAGFAIGKNFHFFESSNGTVYVELWPMGPHRTRPVNFFASVFASYKDDVDYFPGSTKDWKDTTFPQEEITSRKKEPKESFDSHRVFYATPSKGKYRGTACCVDMTLNGNQKVKVGVLHSVVKPRVYLHKFYAFLPDPPFDLVAVTGWFCLSHMLENDIGFASQWISRRIPANRTATSYIQKVGISNCPAVTFVSGITEMIGHDGKNIIISYGVNDCYSRSLIVPKKKVEILLLGKTAI